MGAQCLGPSASKTPAVRPHPLLIGLGTPGWQGSTSSHTTPLAAVPATAHQSQPCSSLKASSNLTSPRQPSPPLEASGLHSHLHLLTQERHVAGTQDSLGPQHEKNKTATALDSHSRHLGPPHPSFASFHDHSPVREESHKKSFLTHPCLSFWSSSSRVQEACGFSYSLLFCLHIGTGCFSPPPTPGALPVSPPGGQPPLMAHHRSGVASP